LAVVDWLTNGSLLQTTTAEMDGAAQRWVGLSAAAWLLPPAGGGQQQQLGDTQLLAMRQFSPQLSGTQQAVNLLVYGSATRALPRQRALEGTRSQSELNGGNIEFLNISYDVDQFNVTYFKALLAETHTNSFNHELCEQSTYTNLLSILGNTTDFKVDRRQFRVWVELLPPTEAFPKGDNCQPPFDDPRTPFNESSYFNFSTSGVLSEGPSAGQRITFAYWDYAGWGALIGRLSVQFPQLVAIEIDDFTHDVAPPDGMFTPELLGNIVNNLHRHSSTISFIPNIYYSQDAPVFQQWPDLSLIGDAMLYFFRNQKQGAGPCSPAACVWGPSATHGERGGGCLAGACAESTVANIPSELVEIERWLPPGRPLIFGIYAGGHSSLGSPTARYVDDVLAFVLQRAEITGGGVMLWPMLAPCGGAGMGHVPASTSSSVCTGGDGWAKDGVPWLIELCAKGCAVRDNFGRAAAGGY
jgi:hypothetical protein